MRMSGFLIGGILGATAALYFTRGNRAMMANMNWGKALDKAGTVAQTAKDMWNMATTIPTGSSQTPSQSQKTKTDTASSMQSVEQVLAKDAKLKQQVDDILKESGTSYPTQ
jgi:hypothetical protein